MTSVPLSAESAVDEATYRRRVRAWTLYDWANSAFATTILAAVLPTYYSQVAGATLPSANIATAYWSLTLSFSLLLSAIISPILGTVSDIIRGKKAFLSIFVTIGIIATGLMVLVDTGDWILASILMVFGRFGFTGSIVFYDALLPHVAKPEEQDSVSARGFAMGYLGGGLLLAINIAMIFALPGTWGPRLSFLSVAIWWLIFTIPLLRDVPEPPAATEKIKNWVSAIVPSLRRMRDTLREIRHYRELFKYLIAFLIYNDAIGTIIGLAVIYGAELGFGTIELILALLLVQFVGIPYSLIFGRLPNDQDPRRPLYLAFVLYNLIALPLFGLTLSRALPADVSGARQPSYESIDTFFGTGTYPADQGVFGGTWNEIIVPTNQTGTDQEVLYLVSQDPAARFDFPLNGQNIDIFYASGPTYGNFNVLVNEVPLLDEDGLPVILEGFNETERYGNVLEISLAEPGQYTVSLIGTGSGGIAISEVQIAEPVRENSLPLIFALLLGVQVIGVAFTFVFGRFFAPLANTLNTKRSIVVALVLYTAIAIWGFFVDTTVEFWFLAWMIAIVQGGSQALSRSLFSAMSPTLKSGEFFGLYGVMEKFSSVIGPLIFAFAATQLGSSRPAILSLILFFIIGGFLLLRVNVEEGIRVAQAEDAAVIKAATS
ncbi:MAG: MFS transporter [Anaerolineae bacterium]|jgi:UMF1 family MFS transporter|nr:MFS transporter [Anaerolineae bacterium]